MPNASVKFREGLNVVTGPSDTGKSLIGEAIDYVFGGSKLRTVPQKEAYDRIFVEITSGAGAQYTLERSWEGGAVRLFETTIDSVRDSNSGRILSPRHSGDRDDTVSAFLLSLCQLEGRLIKTSALGATRTVSFRDLAKLIFVNEDRIFSKQSPVLSGQRSEKPVDTSFFKLLLTGIDDSNVIEEKSAAIKKAERTAREDLLRSMVGEVQAKVDALSETYDELKLRGQALDDEVANASGIMSGFTSRIAELDEERSLISREVQGVGARLLQIAELQARFDLLDRHYDSDLQRLLAIGEIGDLFSHLDEGPCPICGSPAKDHSHDGLLSNSDMRSLNAACQAEITKIEALKRDLDHTVKALSRENQDLEDSITGSRVRLKEIDDELNQVLQPKLGILRESLSRLVQTRRDIDRGLALHDELSRLSARQQELSAIPKSPPKSREPKPALAPLEVDQLSQSIEALLRSWRYPDLERVTFDEASMDIIISGRPRNTQGKGYRAITYSAFAVALMETVCGARRGHPGFVVLDSPLVTYRKRDKKEVPAGEEIDDNIVPAFFDQLSAMSNGMQVIVLENEEPQQSLLSKIEYTHFTGTDFERGGFLLPRPHST